MARVLICVVIILIVSNSWAAADIVTNGNFETGLAGWAWTPTQYAEPEMVASVVSSDEVFGDAGDCFRVNPGADFFHYMQGTEEGGVLSQSINLTAGIEYDVSVGGVAMQGLREVIDAGLIRLYIGDDLLWSWSVDLIAEGDTLYSSYSGTYTPDATASYDLELVLTRTYCNSSPSVYHYVDNVSITAVPEPTLLCLLSSLGMAGLLLRRRDSA